MKTLEDLKKIREEAQQAIKVREGEQKCKVVVAMGTCGIASGAREVMAAILDQLETRGITDVTVTQTGCKGLCEKEPTVDIITAGQPTVTYGYVDAEKARAIVDKHVIDKQIQTEWIVATN